MIGGPPVGPMPDGVGVDRRPACRTSEGQPGPGSDWNVNCPKCQLAWLVARLSRSPEEVAVTDGLMAEASRAGHVIEECR